MSNIPDCRNDEFYNEKYLKLGDSNFVAGYDYAVEQILNMIQYNANVYPDLSVLLNRNIAVINEDKVKTVVDAITNWSEMQRNELITSMIDAMDDNDYRSIKENVDGRQSENTNG